jgi:hypothetical protein
MPRSSARSRAARTSRSPRRWPYRCGATATERWCRSIPGQRAHQVPAVPCDQHRAEVGVYACGGKSAVCEERTQSGKVCLLFLDDLAHCFTPFADPGSLQFEMRRVFHIVENYLFSALSHCPSLTGALSLFLVFERTSSVVSTPPANPLAFFHCERRRNSLLSPFLAPVRTKNEAKMALIWRSER